MVYVRVRPARLHARKPTGGRVELLVLQPMAEGRFALVRGSAKIAPGTMLRVEGGEETTGLDLSSHGEAGYQS